MNAPADFDEIVATFALLDDWEERYRYVIELGRTLPPLAPARRTDATKVSGCASQVWLDTRVETGADGVARLSFEGDSDAHIVRGLIAVLRARLSGRPTAEVRAEAALAAMAELGLDAALSSQRSNGLRAMVTRLERAAAGAA